MYEKLHFRSPLFAKTATAIKQIIIKETGALSKYVNLSISEKFLITVKLTKIFLAEAEKVFAAYDKIPTIILKAFPPKNSEMSKMS